MLKLQENINTVKTYRTYLENIIQNVKPGKLKTRLCCCYV